MSFRTVAALIAVTVSSSALGQDAQSLAAKNLEARGGQAALAAIRGISFQGKAIFPGDFEVKYHEERSAAGGSPRGRTTFSLQGLDLINAYDGRGGWRVNPLQGRKDAERMSGDESRSLADNFLIAGPLLEANRDGSRVTYLGREDFDGTLAYKLKVAQKDGDEFVYWLDPDTFLEIKVAESRRIRGAEQITETELGDYEKVGGVYFPMSIESWPADRPNSRSRVIIASATANPPLPDSLFAEPSGPNLPAKANPAEPPDASNVAPKDADDPDKPKDTSEPGNPPKGN